MSESKRLSCILAAALACCLAACESTPQEPVVRDTLLEKTAKVEFVHMPTRMVGLIREDGTHTTVVAGPAVRNLDQVQAGDVVRLTYFQGVAAEVKEPGTSLRSPELSAAEVAVPPGERPAGAVGATLTATVRIESVDKSFNTVTVKGAEGIERTVAVDSEEGRRFIKKLRPGQIVEVTYTEAISLEVRPRAN